MTASRWWLALFAAGLVAAAPPKNDRAQADRETQQDIAKSLRQIATAANRSHEASNINGECSERQEYRRSDLCAQWKAADAARSAADAAWLFGILGAAIGVLTLAAAVAAALFAGRAATHTKTGADEAKRSADAAETNVKVARESLAAENRAWIEIGELTHGDLQFDGSYIILKVAFKMTNIGQTVALNVMTYARLILDPFVRPDTAGWQAFRDDMAAKPDVFAKPIFPSREEDSREDLRAMIDMASAGYGSDVPEEKRYAISLCLGVRYNTIFDREGDPPHETVKLFMLLRRDERGDLVHFVGPNTVPAADIQKKVYPIDHSAVT
jgi:hypothetical protein